MSKGWESKNVEEQQAAAMGAERSARPDTSGRLAEEGRQRRIQELEMQRERVLAERTASPHRRSALEMALATLERDLEQLGWSIKL